MDNDISLFDVAVGAALSSRLVDFSDKFQIVGGWHACDRGILYFYYGRHRLMISVDVHNQPDRHYYYVDYFRMNITGKYRMAWSERIDSVDPMICSCGEYFDILIDILCGSIMKIMNDSFKCEV